jgi:hypothetical protein
MTYRTIASALRPPLDLDRIGRTANYYADGKFFIEVYENGTCVFPQIFHEAGEKSGERILAELGERPIDFTVKEMDDHNFVIRFSEAVFSIVFQDEFAARRNEIDAQADSAGVDEVLVGRPEAPAEHLMIGLYARTRLLADLRQPAVATVIKPAPR